MSNYGNAFDQRGDGFYSRQPTGPGYSYPGWNSQPGWNQQSAPPPGMPPYPDQPWQGYGQPAYGGQYYNNWPPYGGAVSPKSRIAAALLAWFLGFLGIHRSYVGKVGTGMLWLFTFGLFGIGVLVDFIMIVSGSFTDVDGLPIKIWDA